MQTWIVVNIGCIECGVTSAIVGVYDSKEQAEQIAETLDEKMGWREGGQNNYEVFPSPTLNATAAEYAEAIGDHRKT